MRETQRRFGIVTIRSFFSVGVGLFPSWLDDEGLVGVDSRGQTLLLMFRKGGPEEQEKNVCCLGWVVRCAGGYSVDGLKVDVRVRQVSWKVVCRQRPPARHGTAILGRKHWHSETVGEIDSLFMPFLMISWFNIHKCRSLLNVSITYVEAFLLQIFVAFLLVHLV